MNFLETMIWIIIAIPIISILFFAGHCILLIIFGIGSSVEKLLEDPEKTRVVSEKCIWSHSATVRAKDRTYCRERGKYSYITNVVADNGMNNIFNEYGVYINTFPGQRVTLSKHGRYNKYNELINVYYTVS